jgi:anti-sigma factor RsiW
MSRLPITEADLQAHVDGLLADDRIADVEAYIEARPELARRLADFRQQNAMFHDLFDPILSEPVPESLQRPRAATERSRPSPLRYAAMVGWLALGGVLGWGLNGWQSDSEAAFPRQAAVAHAVYSVETKRYVEVPAADEQAMVGWMSKRMGMPINVPKLADLGYELLGGRLLPGERGPACQVMYQDRRGRRITLYMTREQGRAAQSRKLLKQGPLSVVYWLDGVLGYAVSGELDTGELQRVAQAVSQQVRQQ